MNKPLVLHRDKDAEDTTTKKGHKRATGRRGVARQEINAVSDSTKEIRLEKELKPKYISDMLKVCVLRSHAHSTELARTRQPRVREPLGQPHGRVARNT